MSDPHLSSVRQWPYRPDFNQFKRQAKELLKAYRAGDAAQSPKSSAMNRLPTRRLSLCMTRSACSPEATALRARRS